MNTSRKWVAAFALAATLATSGCLCNADEEYAVTVSAPDSLVVTRNGIPRKMEVVTRLDPSQPGFSYVYRVVEGATGGEGVALTLSGVDPVTNEATVLVLALPVSLRRGDEYPVGATFSVAVGVSTDPRMWGPHDLQQPAQAETAFTVASYTFPPGVYNTTFRAVTSSGTVRITQRQRGWVEMSLNLSFVDGTGRTTTVTGRAQANSEEYTPPCT